MPEASFIILQTYLLISPAITVFRSLGWVGGCIGSKELIAGCQRYSPHGYKAGHKSGIRPGTSCSQLKAKPLTFIPSFVSITLAGMYKTLALNFKLHILVCSPRELQHSACIPLHWTFQLLARPGRNEECILFWSKSILAWTLMLVPERSWMTDFVQITAKQNLTLHKCNKDSNL